MKPKKQTRCAIYSRVSSDQGLHQEFNSLDAQREAAEAYIKSQTHEGWTCVKQTYNDGGYSGGSIERPALQALLNDIRSRKLDVIVVYKVDRLTRSLADFAKLVELFDAHDVSFVSVTQSFNTTTSMGRLTLNVLLSFAQFEREVTGERIRDKFAASRKKGMWMGGIVPYGYKLENRKIHIDPDEAQKIRKIFDLYLEVKSLPKLSVTLAQMGIISRQRKYGQGCVVGGQPFRTGALSHLLSNRVYVGEVKHHKQHFPGEHMAVITTELFEAVQAQLAAGLNRKNLKSSSSTAPLRGLLFDSNGNHMIPVHAKKAGVRYRYYQSWVLSQGQKDKAGIVSRVPGQEIEQAVFLGLKRNFPNQIFWAEDDTDSIMLTDRIQRIDVLQDVLNIHLKMSQAEREKSKGKSEDALIISIAWTKPTSYSRRQILSKSDNASGNRPMRCETRSKLLKKIAQGKFWLDRLVSDRSESIRATAKRHAVSEKTILSTLSLALLAPDIVDAAIDGRLPRNLTATHMLNLPSDWHEQRKLLGLT